MPKGLQGFQKGHPQFNTGRTCFKKGHPSIFKGKKRPNISGNKNGRWTGEEVNINGYIYLRKSGYPFTNKAGYVRRSRLIVEQKLGRYLKPKEIVHHINEIRDDDRIENFMVFNSLSTHRRFHCNPKNVKPSEIIFDGRKFKRGINQ